MNRNLPSCLTPRSFTGSLLVALVVWLLALGLMPGAQASQSYELARASVASDSESNAWSWPGVISGDGHSVAFRSGATNLVPGDLNGQDDIFVRDRRTDTTERVSVTWDGREANGDTYTAAINTDGRFVAFDSAARNLVPWDGNGVTDIFVRDRVSRRTERVSLARWGWSPDGSSYEPSISSDGRYVAFSSAATNIVKADSNRATDIFVYDRTTRRTERVSVSSDGAEANGASFRVEISPDGRYVAFSSMAWNLVPGDRNGSSDVFVHDRVSHRTRRVSVASDGTEANGDSGRPSISWSGKFVAFESKARNLVPGDRAGHTDVFVHDVFSGRTDRISVAANGAEADGPSGVPSISGDGCTVAFESMATNLVPGMDLNGNLFDVFVRDCRTGRIERESVASDGTPGDSLSAGPSVSSDGRQVAFVSFATNFVPRDGNWSWDVFVRDRAAGRTERVSSPSPTAGNALSRSPSAGADGRYVAFASSASNLVPDDGNGTWDVFVRDMIDNVTQRVSLTSLEAEADGWSDSPSISGDGRYVAFESRATNLAPGDRNRLQDVFVRDLERGTTERVSVSSAGAEADSDAYMPSISADGRYVAFASAATTLVPSDLNGAVDVFVHDRTTHQTERVSVAGDGTESAAWSTYPSISSDGRYVAFQSLASNLVAGDTNWTWDIFVRDRTGRQTERVSVGPRIGGPDPAEADGSSTNPSISADGQHVAFTSGATNLIAPQDGNGVNDIYVRNRRDGVTRRASVSSNGVESDGRSDAASISADGRYVVFASTATNLVQGDANGTWDIFVHDLRSWITKRVSTDLAGAEADSSSHGPAISADASRIAFHSLATNLVPGDTNGTEDVFVRRRP